MGCEGRYSEAYEYLSFWCSASLIERVHDGDDFAEALTDTLVRFKAKGVLANVGMIVYNVTTGAQGLITEVTDNVITATLTGGTRPYWKANDHYRIATVDAFEIATIERYLDVTASDIHAALSAQGGCDCEPTAWGLQYLKKLNIVDAALFYTCSCIVSLTDDERGALREWIGAEFGKIAKGEVDPCGGPGKDYPAFGTIERAVDEFSAANIIANRIQRTS